MSGTWRSYLHLCASVLGDIPVHAVADVLRRPAGLGRLYRRHPQRFDEVEALVRQHGFSVSRRSAWGPDAEPQAADVWLGDSMGEMPLYYGLFSVALLGGSFAPLGGQNLIEAAACGCPVVMGPSVFNFQEAATLAGQAGAAFAVDSMAQGVLQAVALAQDAARGAQVRAAAEQFAVGPFLFSSRPWCRSRLLGDG